MTQAPTDEIEQDGTKGWSRRQALKAGVAAGVGVAAWSGATITSLGGTPAYAAGCTFAQQFDLVDCRNTDQGAGGCAPKFRYHELKDFGLPTGFAVTNNIPEGTCCNTSTVPLVSFPSGLSCEVRLVIADPNGNCNTGIVGSVVLGGPTQVSPIPIDFKCPGETNFTFAIHPSDKYRITVRCVTTGSESCFTAPV